MEETALRCNLLLGALWVRGEKACEDKRGSTHLKG